MRGLVGLMLAAAAAVLGVTGRNADRSPQAWRELSTEEARGFDLGYAVFNTQWVEANRPAGRRDGLGPLFNSSSCDACHNSRRRGNGPLDAGVAPQDLVMQVGTMQPDGRVVRGTSRFGYIVNTSANAGLSPEAGVTIDYREIAGQRADGSRFALRVPTYHVAPSDGISLSPDLVLMPRMPPAVQGDGLLEQVPEAQLAELAQAQARAGDGARGRIAWLDAEGGHRIGRFGWQATEPGVADQIGVAFSREMGMTTATVPDIDCGADARACKTAPNGGDPEVEPELLDAVVAFQRLEAVGRTDDAVRRLVAARAGEQLFAQTGCSACHAPRLRIDSATDGGERQIEAYTDLLLHDMGAGLADRSVDGRIVHSAWRTAPLWGLNLSFATGRPVRLLHDGRARGIDEAIEWHGGEADASRQRYERLHADQRQALIDWVASL